MSCSCVDTTEVYLAKGCDHLPFTKDELMAGECAEQCGTVYEEGYTEAADICSRIYRTFNPLNNEAEHLVAKATELLEKADKVDLNKLEEMSNKLLLLSSKIATARATSPIKNISIEEQKLLGDKMYQEYILSKRYHDTLVKLAADYGQVINGILSLTSKTLTKRKSILTRFSKAKMPPNKVAFVYELKLAQEKYSTAELVHVARNLGVNVPKLRNDLLWVIAMRLAEKYA